MKLNLSSKITLFSTAIVCISVAIMSYIVLKEVSTIMHQKDVELFYKESKGATAEIGRAMVKVGQDISSLSRVPPIYGIIGAMSSKELSSSGISLNEWKDSLAIIFESILQENPQYKQVRLIGIENNGREILRVDQNQNEIYRIHDSELQEKGNTEYFKEGISLSKGSFAFSDISYNIEKGKIQIPKVVTSRITIPIYTRASKVFGILVINIDLLSYIVDTLIESNFKNDLLFSDKTGNFIYYKPHQLNASFYDKDRLLSSGFIKDNTDSLEKIVEKFETDMNHITSITPALINKTGDESYFQIFTFIDKSKFSLESQSIASQIILYIVIIGVVSCFLVYIYNKNTMHNLYKLAYSLAPTGIEDLDKFKSLNDEIGMLANAFALRTQKLDELANHDNLTGLPNRNLFDKRFSQFLTDMRNHKHKFALVFIDINNFKEINDSLGHDYGDEILIQFSRKLTDSIRTMDFCARLSGDEFIILLHDIKSQEQCLDQVENIINKIDGEYKIKSNSIQIASSHGIAICPEDGISKDELLRTADQKMYEFKKNKKKC